MPGTVWPVCRTRQVRHLSEHKLSLERLGENISYFVVDVDRLAVQKPELHQQMLTEVVALFERGELKPHEINEFPISKLPEAMKFMTRAAYRGKIVLNMQNDESGRCRRESRLPAGSGLLDFRRRQWFRVGDCTLDGRPRCAHLVLLSRSGPKTTRIEPRSKREERGVRVLWRSGRHRSDAVDGSCSASDANCLPWRA